MACRFPSRHENAFCRSSIRTHRQSQTVESECESVPQGGRRLTLTICPRLIWYKSSVRCLLLASGSRKWNLRCRPILAGTGQAGMRQFRPWSRHRRYLIADISMTSPLPFKWLGIDFHDCRINANKATGCRGKPCAKRRKSPARLWYVINNNDRPLIILRLYGIFFRIIRRQHPDSLLAVQPRFFRDSSPSLDLTPPGPQRRRS